MDFVKLLVATKVYELAEKFRTRDRAEYVKSLKLAPDSQMSVMKREEWEAANPVKSFVKAAYAELLETMELMDKTEAVDAEAALEEIAAGVREGLEEKGQPGIPTVS